MEETIVKEVIAALIAGIVLYIGFINKMRTGCFWETKGGILSDTTAKSNYLIMRFFSVEKVAKIR